MVQNLILWFKIIEDLVRREAGRFAKDLLIRMVETENEITTDHQYKIDMSDIGNLNEHNLKVVATLQRDIRRLRTQNRVYDNLKRPIEQIHDLTGELIALRERASVNRCYIL